MWFKLALLLLYAVLLFVLSRVLETVTWYENGYWSKQLLDPFSLSVKKLKSLLDQRGVSYAGVVEKNELNTLVEDSGEVTADELSSSVDAENATEVQPTVFACGSHFYERVEDNKDSVWIVQVVHPPGNSLLKDTEWTELIQRLAPFGIHVGFFDCSMDYRFCERKAWFSSRLLLALPQGFSQAKDHVKLIKYSGTRRNQAIFDWISYHLASRIHEIKDVREVETDWLSGKGKNDTSAVSWPVRVIMLSKMILPPMFLSALSVKFTGRVKFGKVDIRTSQGKRIMKLLQKNDNKPTYIAVTPEGRRTYGKRRGEILSTFSFDLFLRTLTPDLNDLFKVGLAVVNCACLMGLISDGGGILRRLCKLLWNFVKYNCLFLVLWLPIIGLFHIPHIDTVVFYATKMIRMVNSTDLAGCVRHDWAFYSCRPLLLASTFVAFLLAAGYLCQNIFDLQNESDENDWWPFNTNGYFANYLFNPVTSLTRPAHSQGMEEGMELLIERLAVPNLWLQPMIPDDYIKDLPVWTYTNHAETSDGEETGASDSQSGTESETVAQNGAKIAFVCQHCVLAESLPNNPTETECAEFVMDSDYKCMCGSAVADEKEAGSDHEHGRHAKPPEPRKNCDRNEAAKKPPPGGGTPDGMLLATECVICLDSYHHGNVLCGLPCGHNFHENCIMGWVMRDNHCCPVCRWPSYKSKCKVHLHAE